jgi:uncharacterized protein
MTRSLAITPNRILQRIPVFFLLAFFVSLLLSDLVAAQIPSRLPDTYVNDFAGILAKEDIADLNRQIDSIEKEYTVQIAIVLVKKLPEDMEIEDFARGIGREWHIGTDRKGLVYVASISQRKQRMEVAAGLEGVLTDIITHEIMDHLKPFMKKMDYAGALRNMVSEIGTHLQSEQAATNQSPAQTGTDEQPAQAGQAQPGNAAPVQTTEEGHSTSNWFIPTPSVFTGLAIFLTFLITLVIRIIRSVRRSGGLGLSFSSSDSSDSFSSSDSSDAGSSDSSSSSDSGFDGGGSSNDW